MQSIGRYEIIRELGRGGMATVYLARDPAFERQVAIKVLPLQLMHEGQFLVRFRREAKMIATLEHPYIVPVYDYGEENEQPYIVMRYMSGGTLGDRLTGQPMPLPEAIAILNRLADALDEAHHQNIVHRDLKPGNVMFDARGHAFLSDFGIAKMMQASVALTGSLVVGTPAYMSPEQAVGDKDIDSRSDIYSLGIILYEMLTGRHPYQADTPVRMLLKHITEPVPQLSEEIVAQLGLPEDSNPVLAQAMAKKPEERYATAGEFVQALSTLTTGMVVMPTHPLTLPAIPPEVQQAIDSPLTGAREGAVKELARLLGSADEHVQVAARAALQRLAEQDDSRRVANAAAAVLEEERSKVLRQEEARLAAEQAEANRKAEATEAARVEAEQAETERKVKEEAERLAEQKAREERKQEETKRSEAEHKDKEEEERLAAAKTEEEDTDQLIAQEWLTAKLGVGSAEGIEEEQALDEVIEREQELLPADVEYAKAEPLPAETAPIGLPQAQPHPSRKLPMWGWAMGGLIVLVLLAGGYGLMAAISAPAPRATATTSALSIVTTRTREKDGMVEVFVPAGEFLMGSTSSDGDAYDDEKPQHTVYLDAYWIDQTEVTQGMYAKCVAAGQCSSPLYSSGGDTYPVIGVDWNDAQAYCDWAAARLPTEAEWEKAARGTAGRIYPWGTAAPNANLLNFNVNVGETTEVGKYPNGASPYGALDMAGNVWEWVADWYDATYYQNSPTTNPTGPDSGDYRVLRGGSWSYVAASGRAAYRLWIPPVNRNDDFGFRCLRSAP